MSQKYDRRKFLKLIGAGTAAVTLPLGAADLLKRFTVIQDPQHLYPYRTWEDLYRKQFTWDKIARSTHSANCTGSCSWKVFVKDGVMLREEQAADYPKINDELPDYNPRGCQKGACFVEYVYGAQRVKYPLIRTGERGEGKWKRVDWNTALEYIGNKLLDNIYKHGPDTIYYFSVIPAMSPISFAAGARFAHYTGGVMGSFYDWYCDLPPGEPITWGVQTEACECADWFNSKYIILWGSNIAQTRIPDAHFAYEARYHGAKILSISPDYNSSCIHADCYWAINPGTDGALAMGLAKIIIDNKLYDTEYIKEQTDLPFLVVKGTKRFLRESDLVHNGSEELFYLWDMVTGKPVQVPGCKDSKEQTLKLGKVKPALEGTFTTKGKDGKELQLTTVFERLKESLLSYDIETVSKVTGIPTHEIELVGKELGTVKPAMIIHGAGTNHWFHNDLINRTMILLMALTGNVGKNGGGFNHYVGQERLWPEHGFKELAFPEGPKKQRFQNTTLWTFVHTQHPNNYEFANRKIYDYIEESISKGWMPFYPKDRKKKPSMMFIWRANYLNQAKGHEQILETLWKDLDLIVDINYRMDTTALYSDVVLPAASYYEKTDLNSTDCHSYIHPFTAALDPLFESKTDWQIWRELAKTVSRLAKERGLQLFDDNPLEWKRDLTQLEKYWSHNGELNNDVEACEYILGHSEETKGIQFKDIEEGPKRFIKTSDAWTSDIEEGVAYTPFKHHVNKKIPWRTLTGRQQFYIDHPWYLDFEEELPIHKKAFSHTQEKYPFYWNTPHGRWSIHSTWRDNKYMLRLQRGVPICYMHPEDAQKRGIQDNDWVEIFNDVGSLVCRCQILPGEKTGRLTMYHGWEKFLGFRKGGWQSLCNIKIKPTQLAGGYGQLKFALNYWGPTGNNRDIKVDIRKYKEV